MENYETWRTGPFGWEVRVPLWEGAHAQYFGLTKRGALARARRHIHRRERDRRHHELRT